MSKTDPIHQEHRNYQSQLRELQKRHETDLKELKKDFGVRKDSVKTDYDTQFSNLRSANSEKVFNETERKNQVLEQLKQSLNETQNITQQELDSLAKSHQAKYEDKDDLFKQRLNNQTHGQNETLSNFNSDAMQSLKRLEQDVAATRTQRELATQSELNSLESRQGIRLNQVDRQYNHDYNTQARDFALALSKQRTEHVNTFSQNSQEQQKELEASQKVHSSEVKRALDLKNQTLQQIKKDFETGYNELLANQTLQLQTLQERFFNLEQDLRNEHAQRKNLFSEKIEDPFYRVSGLEPRMNEDEKFYYLKLPASEFEVQGIQLSAHERTIKLTQTRRFEDETVNLETQTTDQTKRQESFIKEFPVGSIVDPNSITKEFTNGEVLFRIAKK